MEDMNNNDSKGKSGVIWAVVILALIVVFALFAANSNDDDVDLVDGEVVEENGELDESDMEEEMEEMEEEAEAESEASLDVSL